MGAPKPLLRWGQSAFLEVICERLWEAGVGEVVVVLGAEEKEIRKTVRLAREKVIVNKRFVLGQLSSLQCGLRSLSPDADAVLVTLVDHPLVSSRTYADLKGAWEQSPEKIVVATYGGLGGHPVIFPRTLFREIRGAPRDEGARAAVRRDPGRVRRVECDDPGITSDIDTPEDYTRLVHGAG